MRLKRKTNGCVTNNKIGSSIDKVYLKFFAEVVTGKTATSQAARRAGEPCYGGQFPADVAGGRPVRWRAAQRSGSRYGGGVTVRIVR
jgi:hypothetical protein